MAPPDQDGAAGAWTTLGKQFAENVEKQPGWVYVLAVAYLAVPLLLLPAQLQILGRPVTVPNEVWAVLLGFAAYWIGDALDKVTFKTRITNAAGRPAWVQRHTPQALKDTRAEAQRTLGVSGGVYDISMRLLEAAHHSRFSVHFINEFSKFFRSLIIPAALVAVIASFVKYSLPIAATLSALVVVASIVVARLVYPRLKTLHMINLYKMVPELATEVNDVGVQRLHVGESAEMFFFFWEDRFITSARKASVPTAK